MAEPKKKSSKTQTATRRHQLKTQAQSYIYCPKCREPKLPHHVCLNCGIYRDKKVIDQKDENVKISASNNAEDK